MELISLNIGPMAEAMVRTAPAPSSNLNVSDLAELLLTTVPELAEAYTRADIELALDDRGWVNSAKVYLSSEEDDQTRQVTVGKSRLYWRKDPLSKQAVRLWTDYALGTGITFASEDAANQNGMTTFMKDRRNRKVMSSEGQRKSSKKLLIDGEIFFAIFTDGGGKKVIRRIDPLQITNIICDPDDDEHILGYRRQLPQIQGRQPKSLYYADWTADAEDRQLGQEQKVFAQEPVVFETDVVVYHLAFDAIAKRGNGLLSSVIDWTREHRRFMEARVAITQALSKYAYKLTAKGGQKAVDAIKDKMQSTYAKSSASTVEKNPQNAPGGTWAQNQALDLEAAPRATGAGDAATDGNQLKLMVSAGTGIFLHYFGDPSTGNLATATAMELPMLKMFDSYQELWKDAYVDIFTIVLDQTPDDAVDDQLEDLDITIELPPILDDDLTKLGTALNSIAGLWPEIAESDAVFISVLTAMEVPEPEEVMKKLRVIRKQQQAQQQKKDDLEMKMMQQGGVTSGLNAKESQELVAAFSRLSEAMSR